MSKDNNRNAYPDIAKLVDEIREYMSIESMKFPYDLPVFSILEPGMNPPFIGDAKEKR